MGVNESKYSDILDKLTVFFHGSDNNKERIHEVRSFQKIVDLIYKFTIKEVPIKGLERMEVTDVEKKDWWENSTTPTNKGKYIQYTVTIKPIFTDPNDFSYVDFDKFVLRFFNNATAMGLTSYSPVEDKDIKDYRVKYEIESDFPKYHIR